MMESQYETGTASGQIAVHNPSQIDARISRFVHLITGLVIITCAVWINSLADLEPYGQVLKPGLVALGTIVLLLGALGHVPLARRISLPFCLVLLGLAFSGGTLEILGRAIKFDFRHSKAAFHRIPPFYRQPTEPTGTVFFRRPGPELWTGQPIYTYLKHIGWQTESYRNEPVITVKYDTHGFRNEENLADWEIAVAGDSFTELGYLPYDKLFTTIFGRILNTRVLNLGVSYTGPLSHLHFVERYGISSSTRHVIIVFSEANDLDDLRREKAALALYVATGRRPLREIKPQTSFLRAMCDRLLSDDYKLKPSQPLTDAFFLSREGRIPLTLSHAPPAKAHLDFDTLSSLVHFMSNYAAFGRKHGLTTWIAYMPVKERVLHGRIQFTSAVPNVIRQWTPSDLPDLVAEICRTNGIRFVDLTPALVAETERTMELTYHGPLETHLNARGAHAVGIELAKHLGAVKTMVQPAFSNTFPSDCWSQ